MTINLPLNNPKLVNKTPKKIAILGASRGLGLSLARLILKLQPETKQLLISRKIQTSFLSNFKESPQNIEVFSADFSKKESLESIITQIMDFSPTQIFYVAGGGPYGTFAQKKWSDHLWALNVNFLFPAEFLHRILNAKLQNQFSELNQICFVGSSIAESNADPFSSSYAAAKHALKGLITSIQTENNNDPLVKTKIFDIQKQLDIRLFSPGYIDTEMLPTNAWPRKSNHVKIESAIQVANQLIQFSNDVSLKNKNFHMCSNQE